MQTCAEKAARAAATKTSVREMTAMSETVGVTGRLQWFYVASWTDASAKHVSQAYIRSRGRKRLWQSFTSMHSKQGKEERKEGREEEKGKRGKESKRTEERLKEATKQEHRKTERKMQQR